MLNKKMQYMIKLGIIRYDKKLIIIIKIVHKLIAV